MNTIKVTELEMAVMMNIAQNEYNTANYGMPDCADDTCTYTWAVSECGGGPVDCPQGKSLSGVLSSLNKKGLVWSHDTGSSEDCTGLTEEGFQIWKTAIESFNTEVEVGVSVQVITSEKEEIVLDNNSDNENNSNIKANKEVKMNKKASKKVDSKAALKRAWRMVRVNGLDKQTAFDLAWRMERGELPKRFNSANDCIRYVAREVQTTIGALIKDNEVAQKEGRLLDASNALRKMVKVLEANQLTYVDKEFMDVSDLHLQIVFTSK